MMGRRAERTAQRRLDGACVEALKSALQREQRFVSMRILAEIIHGCGLRSVRGRISDGCAVTLGGAGRDASRVISL